jgi:hypothetical protein
MFDSAKNVPQTPPPLPKTAVSPLGRALQRTRTFVEPHRVRVATGARRVREWARRRPALAGVAGAAVLLAVALGAAVALDAVPDVDLNPFGPKSIATARADARARPGDGAAQRDLGHALWAARKRSGALRAYGRALAIDAGVADAQLVSNLLASFGGRDQREAETLVWKNKLVEAEDGLKRLVKSRAHAVRWGAVRTLDRLGRGSKAHWETAYIADLDSSQCEVRRTAVEKLGAIGTRRAVAALRGAKADDEKTGGLFRSRCLGERLDDAEQKILARR